jgi:DNA polymerase-3 subunit alpha
MSKFVGLHRHSHYSKRDAIAKIPDIVNRIGELGQTAWALTDHGTTSGLMEAYKVTQKYNKENGTNIKFIFGMEAYWIPNYYIKDRKASCHILLLAKNAEGYRNLLRLATVGYGNCGENPDNYFYTMRLTTEEIEKHKEGLIVTSACMGGILNPKAEVEGNATVWNKNLAYERARAFQSIFGDDFYLEIQCAIDDEQIEYNKRIVQMGKDLAIPVFVTEDSHYVYKHEADTHRRWLGIDPVEGTYYQTDDYYIHSEEEVRAALQYLPDEVENVVATTAAIADKCEAVTIPFGENHFPSMDLGSKTPMEAIREIVEDGWKSKVEGKVASDQHEAYSKQIEHELCILEKIDYINYLLMTHDFVRACRSDGIRIGVGRGSVGGCLVAYLMDITRIDPIKYGLIFERFAHDKRSSSPDVDIDVPNSRRQDAIQYLEDKYKLVYHVRTFGYMGERAGIQRAARALGYEPSALRNLPKTIEEQTDGALKDLASKFVGIIQNYGCHASAIMLFPSDPTEWCAIEKQGDDYVCAYEYHDLEKMGLLKEDVLGIKTLDAIEDTCLLTNADVDNLPDDDKATFDMLCNDDVLGCFQIESGGMRKILGGIKPSSVFDLVPLVALYRPSTIQSGTVDDFIERRNGKAYDYLHPKLAGVLSDTYGVMLYQEQAMRIVEVMAGYDLGQADMFRRAIGRKIPSEMAELIPRFVNDGKRLGVSPGVMEKLAEWLTNAAAYQFNKSHSAAYGYTCYQTAYLKAHYPIEYFCSYLNAYKGDKQEDLLVYVHDAKQYGIRILPPDARSTTCDWHIVRDKDGKRALRMALNYIAGVGELPVPLESYDGIPKDKAEALIKAGAFDFLGDRQSMLEHLYKAGTLDKLQRQLELATERYEKNKTVYESAKDGTKKKSEAHSKMLKYSNQKWEVYQKIEEANKTCKNEFDASAAEMEVLGMTFNDIFSRYDVLKYEEPEVDTKGKIVEDSSKIRVVLCVVRRIKHWKQRNGKPMMFFTIECPSGKSYDIVMFNSCYTPIEVNRVYVMSLRGNKFRKLL